MEVTSKEYKHTRWAELNAIDLQPFQLDGIDARLLQYVAGVHDDEQGHNLFEILGVLKFLRCLQSYEFKAAKVRKFAALYESLKFSGTQGRKSYRLTPIQYYQFASMLGFYRWEEMGEAYGQPDTDTKIDAGKPLSKGEGKRWKYEGGKRYELRRLVQRAIIFCPRKFSKTTSTTSLAAYELFAGDANAQAYTAANSYKQAQICFKEISKILKQLDPSKKYFKATRETLKWKDNGFGKESFVECLTGGGETKDGLNASLVIFDEYAAAKYVKGHSDGAELLMVLESSMGARREPMVVIITTASRIPDGPFALELDNAKRILLDEWVDDTQYACLLMPDAFDDDYGDPLLWQKVNPHIGVTVQKSYYARAYEKALHDAEQMMEFKTKLLNLFVNGSIKTWIPRQLAMYLQRDFNIDECVARPECMVGIDMSVSDDFSVVVYNIRNRANKTFYCWLDCYIPAETLANHANAALYQIWVDAGWMKVCPGAVIDHKMIADDILHRNKVVKILQIGYDPAKANLLINTLTAAIQGMGADPTKIMIPINQSYYNFTSATETLEYAAKVRPAQLALSRSPIWPYCFGNAYLDETKSGLKKPIKEKVNLKIDPVIGAIETFWLYGNYKRQVTTQ